MESIYGRKKRKEGEKRRKEEGGNVKNFNFNKY
jgi:hypothetical protein